MLPLHQKKKLQKRRNEIEEEEKATD
jgi:hypothetical protein